MIDRVCSLLKMQVPERNRGLLFASGTTVPTDATDGYQTGCVFLHTDGGNNTSLYVNEGSVTSCQFNAITTGGPADTLVIGAFASLLQGSGIPISSTQTGAALIYSDDAGANIAVSCRGLLSRFLLTIDQSAGSIRAAMGQLKLATGVDVATGIYTGVQGYVELAGTHSAQSGATFSCIDASLEIGTALTVDSGGEACGIHVETTGTGTITNNGTCAAVLIDKATGAANWPYGVYVVGSTCHQAFVAGVQGTGVETTTTYPFAVEIHNEANANVEAIVGGTGSSAGIYNRYEIALAQTSQCNHISVFAKLRPKANMADGIHCGVYGLVEASETIEISGTSTTLTCAAHFALDFGANVTVSAGHVNGVCIDSSINSSANLSGATLAGLRFKKSGTSQAWTTGIVLEASACTTGISIGTCTTAALHILGDQAIGILFDVDASATDGLKMSVDGTFTLTEGIEISGAGTVTTGINLAPTAGTTGISIGSGFSTALSVVRPIVSTPVAAGTFLDFVLQPAWVSGTLIRADFGASLTLTGAVVGVGLDLGTNVVATSEQSVTGISITLPQSTNTAASPALKGVVIAVSGAMTAGTSGDPTYTGVEIATPAINCTLDTITSLGIHVTTGAITQTGGTAISAAYKATGGTVTSGTAHGVFMDGAFSTGITVAATVTTGISVAGGTVGTGLNIGACSTAAIAVLDVITITPDAAGTLLDFVLETEWVSGTLIRADFGSSTTYTGTVVGAGLDLGSNIVATSEQSVTGVIVTLPQSTNDAASPALVGFQVAVSGAMTAATSGDPTYCGVRVATPAITCVLDTIVSTGVEVTTGQCTQTGGTATSTGVLVTGGTLTSGTANGVTVAGAWTNGVNISGTCVDGINIGDSCTTGIDIGTSATGIDFTGSLATAVGIKFTNATFAPNTARDNRAIELGSRASEIGLAFVGGAGAENFEPIQMNFNCTGTNPASVSTVNIWQGGMFLDTADLGNVRLKWSDLLTTVNFDCRDVYIHQAEIDFGNAACTVSSQVAALGVVVHGGTGGVTCATYSAISATLGGTGTPANAICVHVCSDASCVVASGIQVQGADMVTAIRIGDVAQIALPTNAFAFPAIAVGGMVQGYTTEEAPTGKIRILVDGATRWLAYWD